MQDSQAEDLHVPDRRRRRAGSHRRRGRERAGQVARRIGVALRDARRRAGLRQVDVAERAGISQSFYSRLERGASTSASLETLAASAEAVGHQLAAFLELAPGATPPRDVEHLRNQQLVIDLATGGGWRATPEAALPGDGPRPRSIDVLLDRSRRREIAVVEIINYVADVGDSMRNLEAKVLAVARHEPGARVGGLLLVRRTRRNRQVIADLRTLFAARYPASSAAWLRALADHEAPMPTDAGLAWTSVRGDRLIASQARSSRRPSP
jgi:transcriptional regulator with XRE-family HTH domain